MIKLSIIVPIYKVEKYIIECIESICCQLMDGVEVILVNDGTPDRSMEIAKDYIRDNYSQYLTQFVFVDQENRGQSVARNVAIKKAKGKYIAFLDSDDYLMENYIFNILYFINGSQEIDIIHFNAKQYDENKKMFIGQLNFVKHDGIVGNNECYREKLFIDSQWYPWLRVIRKDIMCKYEFLSNVYMEDKLLFPELYCDSSVNKILEINKPLICYRHRVGSSIRSGYNEALLNGIDYGVNKFSGRKNRLFSIIYNQFIVQKISIMVEQRRSFIEIYNFIKIHNININYEYTLRLWILKKSSILYIALFKLKKMVSDNL